MNTTAAARRPVLNDELIEMRTIDAGAFDAQLSAGLTGVGR